MSVLYCIYQIPPDCNSVFRSSTIPKEEDHADAFSLDPGFDIRSVASLARSLPAHSWEYGTASEALLELYNPSFSVFGDDPFPNIHQEVSTNNVPSLAYAQSKIAFGSGANELSDGDGATGDPASLGVSAVLLGRTDETYQDAAKRTMDYLINTAPRFSNGAISQRADVAELWADFMYMAPPFLAYYAVSTSNSSLLLETVRQCGLYRELPKIYGLWRHIVGPQLPDPGLWSTGNAWSAAGMTRVLATVMKAPRANSNSLRSKSISSLTTYIKEILDGAIDSPLDNNLLRNYLNDTSGDGHGFGEISGSTMLANVVYRMVVLRPDVFLPGYSAGQQAGSTTSKYLTWAESIRRTIGSNNHVSNNGTVAPAVDPLDWGSTTPYTAGSPEGQNFVVLMYASWRDCVLAGICAAD
ncbi:hypothetical protein K435DRAFT_828762 [Dendrothele bispora CBS 962.96]|uniref:Six-hairpin glycosidase n=1 Tax=Dendrothele bispora (strain CBS 962.96) TaxID=1314807 RepID=A0A4S8M4U1_DENBC|nr:hypothetical protein K435DRAFT_828762 [Dendrothele bispora CBS 962.96]